MDRVRSKYQGKEGLRVFDNYLSETKQITERPEWKIPIAVSETRVSERYVEELMGIVDEFITHVY